MLAGLLSASLFIGKAVLGGIRGLCLLQTSPASSSPMCWAVLGVPLPASTPRTGQLLAPFPESAWSGLDLGALTVEHSAQGTSNGALHLPLSDLILEEGSWEPIWLARRGAIPLLWGAECKTHP